MIMETQITDKEWRDRQTRSSLKEIPHIFSERYDHKTIEDHHTRQELIAAYFYALSQIYKTAFPEKGNPNKLVHESHQLLFNKIGDGLLVEAKEKNARYREWWEVTVDTRKEMLIRWLAMCLHNSVCVVLECYCKDARNDYQNDAITSSATEVVRYCSLLMKDGVDYREYFAYNYLTALK